MGETLSLDNICVDDTVCVVSLETDGTMRRRLFDIGLTDGAVVKCVGKSPMGDPVALFIRGAVIALRKSDCRSITVRKVG